MPQTFTRSTLSEVSLTGKDFPWHSGNPPDCCLAENRQQTQWWHLGRPHSSLGDKQKDICNQLKALNKIIFNLKDKSGSLDKCVYGIDTPFSEYYIDHTSICRNTQTYFSDKYMFYRVLNIQCECICIYRVSICYGQLYVLSIVMNGIYKYSTYQRMGVWLTGF